MSFSTFVVIYDVYMHKQKDKNTKKEGKGKKCERFENERFKKEKKEKLKKWGGAHISYLLV